MVKVYIETSLCGPTVKDGKYAAILEYITKKGPATLLLTGKEKDTTFYRSTLQAIVHALKRIKKGNEVTIYTYCSFVNNMFTSGTAKGWKENDWKKSNGEPVQNKDLWQQYLKLAEGMKIEMRFSKHNDYRQKLKKAMEGI